VASEEVLTKVKDNSIVDLKTALIWLAANAADDTDYVVLIGEDSELTDAYRYDSKEGSSGVTITLRGIDQERKIYGDAILSGSTVPVFNIKPGTTLALGDKVTFDGNSESRDTNHPPVVRLQGGSFEMLPGSKITNVYGSTVISINPTTAEGARIILRGGTITDNIVSASLVAGASNGTAHPLRVEMYDDAVITKNRMQNTFTNNISATNKHPYIFGHIAAVSLPSGGTFIMRGGEISYNSPRGVYIGEYTPVTNTPGREGVFEMKGGTISHNGNDAIQFKDSTAYSLAAGVYMATVAGSFSMTGGAISDNGSEHTTLPYSGIYLTSRRLTPSGNTNNNVLDGTVAIKNNKVSIVGVSADEPVTIYLGNNFIADSIEVVLTIGNATYTNLVNYWNGKRLLASLPEDGLTIDSAVVSKFVLSGHYYLSSSNVNKQCEQISGYTSRISTTAEEGISGAGYVVVTKNDD
jgi:hypothetical protein